MQMYAYVFSCIHGVEMNDKRGNEVFAMLIKRESSIPIYQQIADDISDMIENGKMQKGDRLPTEFELVDKYDVSRATVRKAISQLVEKDMISVSPGKGMFIKNPVIEMDFNELRGIYEILAMQGLETHTEVIGYDKVIPPPYISKNLELPVNEEVFSIERIYYVDKQPLAFSTVYFPSELEFTESQVQEKKIYDLMQNELSIVLDKAKYTIKVSQAKEYLNDLLDNDSNTPFLKMERTTFCTKKQPRESTVAYFRSDKYQFNFSITKTGEINI